MSTQRELFEVWLNENHLGFSAEYAKDNLGCSYRAKYIMFRAWQARKLSHDIDTANYKDTIRKLTEQLNVATKLLDSERDKYEALTKVHLSIDLELTKLRAQVAEQQWISVDDLKLETRVLLLTESDEVVAGWKRVLKDDNCVYFCFGLETQSWDWEWTYDLGGVIGWMPLPQPPANKDV